MESKFGFMKLKHNELYDWLLKQIVTRSIKLVQLHHTWQPNYATFIKNPDGFTLQRNMQSYHKNSNGWTDIAQHFTVLPDGCIITGRSLNNDPAGIYGGNSKAVCIEVLGNFDIKGDVMTEAQKTATLVTVKSLMEKFNLTTSDIRYHSWYTETGKYLGDYDPKRSAKTCPGTNFFGGNTKNAFNTVFKPLLEATEVEEKPMTAKEAEAFNKLVEEVKEIKATLNKHLETEHKIYNYLADMPDWCKPIVTKGIELKRVNGVGKDDNGNLKLGLTINDIKALAYDLREEGYRF